MRREDEHDDEIDLDEFYEDDLDADELDDLDEPSDWECADCGNTNDADALRCELCGSGDEVLDVEDDEDLEDWADED